MGKTYIPCIKKERSYKSMKKDRKRSRKGFTLVELIIVIAVIGVLAAILIPIFSSVIKKANSKSAMSDARNAVSLYMTEALERRLLNEYACPENIVILVQKGGKYYAYGFNTTVAGTMHVSNANEEGMDADDLNALIREHSWNGHNIGGTYDPNATYSESDGYFYLVPYTGLTPDNPNVRGFATASSTGQIYHRLDDYDLGGLELNIGNDTVIYHGCLVNGTYDTESTSGDSSHSGNTTAPTPTPAAAVTHTISLDLNGVTASQLTDTSFVTSYTVNHGDDLASAGTPAVADGTKTFDGWYENDTEVTFPMTNVQGDHILTAHWQTVTKLITISDEWNGHHADISGQPSGFAGGLTWNAPVGTNLNTIIDNLTATLNPTVAGVGTTATGWTVNGASYTGSPLSLTQNVTIAPVFGTTQLTLRFYNGADELTALRMTVAYNSENTALPATPIAEGAGSHFRGWKLNNSGSPMVTYVNPITTDLSFTLDQGAYRVTFYNGSTPIATTNSGDTYNIPTVDCGAMNYLAGWNVASGTPTTCNTTGTYTATSDNVIINANVQSKSVNVTFVSSPTGASNMPANGTRNFATDGNTITLTTPSLEHYTFTGYSVTSQSGATATISGSTLTLATSSTGSVTVTASFTANPTYTVTYNKNTDDTVTGMPSNDTGVYAGSHTLSTATPTRTGYDFIGWVTSSGSTTTVSQITVSGNTTVYAVWQIKSFAVTFTDGTNSQNKSYNYNTTITLADENPLSAPSGKELDKFTVGGADATTLTVTSNATVTVVWKDAVAGPEPNVTVYFKQLYKVTSGGTGWSASSELLFDTVTAYAEPSYFGSGTTARVSYRICVAELRTQGKWPAGADNGEWITVDSNGNHADDEEIGPGNSAQVTSVKVSVDEGRTVADRKVTFYFSNQPEYINFLSASIHTPMYTEPAILPNGEYYTDR